MKRLLILLCILVLAGCSQKQEKTDTDMTAVIVEEQETVTPVSLEEVDVDMTEMSSILAFATVNEIAENVDAYVGQTIRIKGIYNRYYNPRNDFYYFVCTVVDNTACCSQGLEFILDESYVFPDDYPEVNEEITVTGTIGSYTEGNYKFCNIINARYSRD